MTEAAPHALLPSRQGEIGIVIGSQYHGITRYDAPE